MAATGNKGSLSKDLNVPNLTGPTSGSSSQGTYKLFNNKVVKCLLVFGIQFLIIG